MAIPGSLTEQQPKNLIEPSRELKSAAREGKLQLFKSLLFRLQALSPLTQHDLESLLITAACHGHIEIVTYLLDEGVNPPHYLPSTVAYHWHNDDDNKIIPILQISLDRGWDVNTVFPTLGTVLLQAIDMENVPLIEFLILNGADVNMTQFRVQPTQRRPLGTPRGFRPLDSAASGCSLETIQLLLKHGARVGDCNALHRLPSAHDPESRIPILDFFLEQGMDINAIERVDPASGVHASWPVGTPLIYAARTGNVTIFRALLERGADPTIESTGGYGNALDWALNESPDAPDPEIVEMLSKAMNVMGDEK